MNLRSLIGLSEDVKRIGLYGVGKSTLALLRLLPEDAEITLRSDKKIDRETLPFDRRIVKICDGDFATDRICEQVIFFSPSVRRDTPALRRASERGVIFSSECELFFKTVKAPVYAVTGSDGKSTTSTLISRLLSEKYGKVALCGNIGVPFISSDAGDAYVAELSSFQLTYLSAFTERAVITNVTPNHLNWHTSFEEYKNAKLSLLDHTRGAVLCIDNSVLSDVARKRGASALSSAENSYAHIKESYDFSVAYTLDGDSICRNGVPFMPLCALLRREKHNLQNFLTALAATDTEVSPEHAIRVAEEFSGLAHRCEYVATLGGADYFDSSIDTSPERTATTLRSLGKKCYVLLGGKSKGLPFDKLLPTLRELCKEAVLFGECADEIEDVLSGKIPTKTFKSLDEAVRYCIESAETGDTVILSPAATSYDAYASFEERGEHFKKIIKDHIKTS